jgi:23S rRNA pseudouridine1911/1915/1917 synthase
MGLSRSQLKRLIDSGDVLVNGATSKASAKLREGDIVVVTIPPPVAVNVEPQAMDLSVLFEDEHLIVIDKPAGLVVHPAPGHPDGTLVNALLAGCGEAGRRGR